MTGSYAYATGPTKICLTKNMLSIRENDRKDWRLSRMLIQLFNLETLISQNEAKNKKTDIV